MQVKVIWLVLHLFSSLVSKPVFRLRPFHPDPVSSLRHPDRTNRSDGKHLLHDGLGPRAVLRRLPSVSSTKVRFIEIGLRYLESKVFLYEVARTQLRDIL